MCQGAEAYKIYVCVKNTSDVLSFIAFLFQFFNKIGGFVLLLM